MGEHYFLDWRRRSIAASLAIGLAISATSWQRVSAQDTPDYFRQNCINCHTIGGGRLAGPDLKNVGQRKDAEWLINFLMNPKAVISSGDAYAARLVEESRGVVMPVGPGMNRYRAEQILKLIEAESQLEESQFKGMRVSTEPFTAEDRAAGQEFFVGQRPLKNGGPACNGCHAMHDLTGLGGGRLGPDLTRVFERLKGRVAMSAWLSAPATETMQPIFRGHPLDATEIHALTAYFESSAQESEQSGATSRVAFLLLGLGLAAGLVFVFDALWKGRFQAVRRPLVSASVDHVHAHAAPLGRTYGLAHSLETHALGAHAQSFHSEATATRTGDRHEQSTRGPS